MTATMTSRVTSQMRKTFERAARANVNVYTVDACGLRAPSPAARFGTRQPTCVPGLEVEYLQTVAENTGARAVINTNDFEPGLSAVFQENASYYLLGFQQPAGAKPGSLRKLEVRVNRPNVIVRTRNGYETAKPEVARRAAESPLGAALAGVLPKADLPLQMSAVPLALPDKRESAVAIIVGVRQPIREAGVRHVEKVDLQVSAFNVEGKSFGSKRLRADVTLRAGATGLAEYEVLSRLDLRPGRYQLRIAANVGSLSTGGSLYYDVDVPDVGSTPLAMSGLMLGVEPGPVVAPADGLKPLVPIRAHDAPEIHRNGSRHAVRPPASKRQGRTSRRADAPDDPERVERRGGRAAPRCPPGSVRRITLRGRRAGSAHRTPPGGSAPAHDRSRCRSGRDPEAQPV